VILDRVDVAKLGRAVGLKGEMRLHLLSDFPEQFKKGARFRVSDRELEIEYYNHKRGVVKFLGIDTPEEAKKLTNKILTSTLEETRKSCSLEEGEYFWFDIIGCDLVEEGKKLGRVEDIRRYPSCDYLLVKSSEDLVKDGFAKTFLVPFMDRFIAGVDLKRSMIVAKGAMDILRAS